MHTKHKLLAAGFLSAALFAATADADSTNDSGRWTNRAHDINTRPVPSTHEINTVEQHAVELKRHDVGTRIPASSNFTSTRPVAKDHLPLDVKQRPLKSHANDRSPYTGTSDGQSGLKDRPSAAKTTSTSSQPVIPSVFSSIYQPKNPRDPFLRVGEEMPRPIMKTSSAATINVERAVPASAFRLRAIINVPPNPVAQINDQELRLNTLTTVETPVGAVQVKMLQIHSDHVVLDVGGQQIEIKIEEMDSTAQPKGKDAGGLISSKMQKFLK